MIASLGFYYRAQSMQRKQVRHLLALRGQFCTNC
jgi:hypothetical protein